MTDSPTEMVNLLGLAASLLASSVMASITIRDMSGWDGSESNNNARLKLDGTVVTDADTKAQSIIMKSILQVAPLVRIVGEESPQEVEEHDGVELNEQEEECQRIYAKFAQDEICKWHETVSSRDSHEAEATEAMESHIVDSSRVSVLVDPLDGTQSYANGDYRAVSILIAIILDNTPYFGLICKPFGLESYPTVLDSGCVVFYGGHLLKGVFVAGGEQPLTRPSLESSLPKAIISLKKKSEGLVQDFVDHLIDLGVVDPDVIHASGAGEKSLRLVLATEKEGIWFLPKTGTSRWDVAASDALLRAIGGRLTDKYGKDMDYSVSRTQAENLHGVIASNDGALHAKCIQIFSEGNWEEREKTT